MYNDLLARPACSMDFRQGYLSIIDDWLSYKSSLHAKWPGFSIFVKILAIWHAGLKVDA
jgi:hypothetical protein